MHNKLFFISLYRSKNLIWFVILQKNSFKEFVKYKIYNTYLLNFIMIFSLKRFNFLNHIFRLGNSWMNKKERSKSKLNQSKGLRYGKANEFSYRRKIILKKYK
ncbi:hypothetical protein H312_03442 [Anncaliia algerae PRA339]|uniref:Uncharacterized protein n=1 Tax=Anncaliia algerae PRA339 TaxID=1288291 RepID=A0A059EVX6_9MICR|nr:hypothetical protein H312_03442 [Anncaliia algerae PRA339]